MIERRADNSEMCGLIPLEATRHAGYSVMREIVANEFLAGLTPATCSNFLPADWNGREFLPRS